jgi:hypothetical protein
MAWQPLVLSGDVEVLDKCQRSYRLVRTALAAVPAQVFRRHPRQRQRHERRDKRIPVVSVGGGATASVPERK